MAGSSRRIWVCLASNYLSHLAMADRPDYLEGKENKIIVNLSFKTCEASQSSKSGEASRKSAS
jgi:hypothetical protein